MLRLSLRASALTLSRPILLAAADQLTGLPVAFVVVPSVDQADRKFECIATLDPHSVVAIGNGGTTAK
jgi:hypothetical protein